ncbi:MAG: hypothetical protein H7A51_11860 [Akkermansiaceae bacterium]|nr:hypothetical protein [Akkermansiaceae bacterium]
MKGQPPIQALLLLVVLAIVGFAGSLYIDTGAPATPAAPQQANDDGEHTVEAEIEFTFSTPPQSYTLKRPSESGGEDVVLLSVASPAENPDYRDVKLVAHRDVTYWLDVVWPDDAVDGSHHFVQVSISPDHGEGQKYSFFSSSREMNETFEYNTGGHHE